MIKLTIDSDCQSLTLSVNEIEVLLDTDVMTTFEADSSKYATFTASLSEKQAWQLTDLIQVELRRMECRRDETRPLLHENFDNIAKLHSDDCRCAQCMDVVDKRKFQQPEDNAELMKYAATKDDNSCKIEEAGETQTSLEKLRTHLELNKKFGYVCICPICEDYSTQNEDRVIWVKCQDCGKDVRRGYTHKCGEY